MGSGSRKRPDSVLPVSMLALCALLTLASCSGGSGGFASSLAKLDDLLLMNSVSHKTLVGAFAGLYSQARSVSDWLSIAKRCRTAEALGDSHRSSQTAERALKAFPGSEVLLEVAAWLYLRDSRPELALDLYSKSIDIDAHPSLWSEAALRVLSSGNSRKPSIEQSGFASLAETSGDLSWYIDAALVAMKAGDRFSASAWLRSAMKEGATPPFDLLWDAGLSKELARIIGRNPEPSLLPLGGDAAWASGDEAMAATFWRRALRSNPELSWKLEADLAAIGPEGEAALAAARSLASRYPNEPEAQRFAAALLLREGKHSEARALIPLLKRGNAPLPSLLALELEAGKGSENRLAAEAVRQSEAFADSALVRSGAMRILLERGRYEDFLVLLDEAMVSNLAGPDAWFYTMFAHVLRGEKSAAMAIATREAAALGEKRNDPSAFGAFAQGLLLSLEGAQMQARYAFGAALDLAKSPRERSMILKETGKLELAFGDGKEAQALWKAAAEADPDDAEAVLLSTKKP